MTSSDTDSDIPSDKTQGAGDSNPQQESGAEGRDATSEMSITYPTEVSGGEKTEWIKGQVREVVQDLLSKDVTPEQLADLISPAGNKKEPDQTHVDGADDSPKIGPTSEKSDPLIGQVIDSKYAILEVLGEGGMGRVYKAKHIMTEKIHALKTLRPDRASKSASILRFQREAKAASKIDHLNCVAVTDFGVWEELFYMVMEYAPGPNLAQIIHTDDRRTPLSLHRALPIFIQICAGLGEAHKLGIIHRDIKPSNVILMSKGTVNDLVKITDFGIAKLRTEGERTLTEIGEVFGSPPYMSPEQCLGKDPDARSDIYSLGCLMYQALSGRVPFEGKSSLETINLQTTAKPEPLMFDDVDKTIAAALNELVVERTLQKETDKRPQTTSELQSQLTLIQKAVENPNEIRKLSRIVRIRPIEKVWQNQTFKHSIMAAFVLATPLVLFLLVYEGSRPAKHQLAILEQAIDMRPYDFGTADSAPRRLTTMLSVSMQPPKLKQQLSTARGAEKEGNFERAFYYYRDAISTAKDAELPEAHANIASRAALCALILQQYDLACAISEDALKTLDQLGQGVSAEAILPSIVRGESLVQLNRIDEGLRQFEHMLKCTVGADLKDHIDELTYGYICLANALRQKGNDEQAERYYKNATSHIAGLGEAAQFNKLSLLDQLGMLRLHQGKVVEARHNFDEARSLMAKIKDMKPNDKAKLFWHTAMAARSQKPPDFWTAIMNGFEAKHYLSS
jgi:serine/threonine protein kinase